MFASIVGGQEGLNILSILGIAALGMAGAFAVACFVKLFGIAFLGLPRSEHAENAKEVPVFMNLGIGILAGACLLIGLFPLAMLKLVDKAAFSLTGASIF